VRVQIDIQRHRHKANLERPKWKASVLGEKHRAPQIRLLVLVNSRKRSELSVHLQIKAIAPATKQALPQECPARPRFLPGHG
jgi:hypothetical protein